MKQVRKRNDDRGEGAFLCVRACVGVGALALRVACGFGDDSLLFQPRRQVRETGEGPGRRLAGHPQGAAASDCDSSRCSPLDRQLRGQATGPAHLTLGR